MKRRGRMCRLPLDECQKRAYTGIIAGLTIAIIAIISMALIVILTGNAVDRSIDNQNEMLCKSAKISGNEQWLDLCEGYYRTGDVKYLRGAE